MKSLISLFSNFKRPEHKKEDSPMLLFVGLGNPGSQYDNNRHNIGFMAIDAITNDIGGLSFRNKFSGNYVETTISGVKVGLLKPETFMNEFRPIRWKSSKILQAQFGTGRSVS